MPSTAIISPQIVDSTSIGRDLITAADQASAQAIIGVTGVDVTADYNWTGNHDFSNTVTVDTVNASGATLDLQLGGSSALRANSGFSYYYAGGGNTYILQGRNFIRPQGGAAPFDLGGTSHRWRTVFGEDGTFSGNLNTEVGGTQRVYNLGTEGDADTEYLETSWDTNVATIETKATGNGSTLRELRLVNGTTSLKLESTLATLTGDVVMAANVDFTGLPTADPLVAGRLWNDGGTMKISAG